MNTRKICAHSILSIRTRDRKPGRSSPGYPGFLGSGSSPKARAWPWTNPGFLYYDFTSNCSNFYIVWAESSVFEHIARKVVPKSNLCDIMHHSTLYYVVCVINGCQYWHDFFLIRQVRYSRGVRIHLCIFMLFDELFSPWSDNGTYYWNYNFRCFLLQLCWLLTYVLIVKFQISKARAQARAFGL